MMYGSGSCVGDYGAVSNGMGYGVERHGMGVGLRLLHQLGSELQTAENRLDAKLRKFGA